MFLYHSNVYLYSWIFIELLSNHICQAINSQDKSGVNNLPRDHVSRTVTPCHLFKQEVTCNWVTSYKDLGNTEDGVHM